jgi:hypothetical protein
MTKNEFIKRYCNAPVSASDCAQVIWDLLEEIEETLNNGVDAIGACKYKIETLLEVMNEALPDYKLLAEMYDSLSCIKNV